MNILLVDDDRFIIQALYQKINWESLGVNEVFSAFNMVQAQKIIEEKTINLLICDIEMPQGNGLQLLSWIRSENYNIQAIFLTNYADFNYAQKAIELQSFEYYLKPIDYDKLELIIKKVLNKIRIENNNQANISLAEESFWFDYLRKANINRKQAFINEANKRNIQIKSNQLLLPLIITINLNEADFGIQNFSWTAKLKENLNQLGKGADKLQLLSLFKVENFTDRYFCLIKIDSNHIPNKLIETILQEMRSILNQNIQITCGIYSTVDDILENTQSIYKFISDYCGRSNYIYDLNLMHLAAEKNNKLNSNFLNSINLNNLDSVEKLIENELKIYEKSMLIRTNILKSLHFDLVQQTGIILNKNGILAHKLFQNSQYDFLSQRIYNSIESFKIFVSYYLGTAIDYIQLVNSKQSITQSLIDYLDSHFTEELSRKHLSEIFFLSPDYLTRILKKATGTTLINYITQKRIALAKDFLKNSDMPIYLIANQVGYDNYSYFTKIFKKNTDMSPIEFRNCN